MESELENKLKTDIDFKLLKALHETLESTVLGSESGLGGLARINI